MRGPPQSIPFISTALRAERLLQNMKLKDVERITGYSDSSLNNAEKGLHNVSFNLILSYVSALGYELRLAPINDRPILPTLPIEQGNAKSNPSSSGAPQPAPKGGVHNQRYRQANRLQTPDNL